MTTRRLDKMKIVILDGHTIVQDDMNWDSFRKFGEVTAYDRTPYEEDETVRRIDNAQIVLTSKVPITAAVMDRCPNMKYVGVTATGYNIVDVKAARERGVTVTNVPGYGTETVAEFAFALLLHMTRKVAKSEQTVRRGDWLKSIDFCYLPVTQESLFGKTMGVVGFGQIGRRVAELSKAFGMKVLVYTRHPDTKMESDDIKFVDFDQVLRESDVVSLHCPLTKENQHMMDEEAFKKMKPTAYLINTSRGPLVKEADLKKALEEGWIRGAALDVLEKEPMEENCPLIGVKNCVIVPHVAWATNECRSMLLTMLEENIKAYLSGHPIHVVS